MRFIRFLVAALCLTGVALFAPLAGAAVVTPSTPEWVGRPTPVPNNIINRADCLAEGASIKFDVEVTPDATANLFQVWSGTTCDMKMSRDDNTDCVMVAEGDPENSVITVSIKDILQASTDGAGIGTGTEEACTQSSGSSGETPRSLFFLVLNQSTLETLPAFGRWDFKFDLEAPEPPTATGIGPGEGSLIVDVGPSSADDLSTYRVYCAVDEGGCTSSVLVAGGEPPTASCGSTNAEGAGKATGKGLINGVSYAVAVAAEDKLGNLSKLSALQCGTPKEVTGFYEAYSAAGGQGGGGFCSFAPPRRGAAALTLGLLLGAATLLRRRS